MGRKHKDGGWDGGTGGGDTGGGGTGDGGSETRPWYEKGIFGTFYKAFQDPKFWIFVGLVVVAWLASTFFGG